MPWSGWFPDNLRILLRHSLDLGLVCGFILLMLLLVTEHRTRWMIRGLIFLMAIAFVSENLLKLTIFSFFLDKLVLLCSLAMGIGFQSDFRRFLEHLGKGQWHHLFRSSGSQPKENTVIDEIVEAVKELSQNRTGALMVIETFNTIEERAFLNPGVRLHAEISKELLQTIFQTDTLLHDGAIFIRGSELVAAGVILPLSERTASRQLGTRHRAAMGITERAENCICVVVSEETGSISLGEKGILNRPLTSTKLKELLEEKLSAKKEGEVVTGVTFLSKQIRFQGWNLLMRFFNFTKTRAEPKKSLKPPNSLHGNNS